MEMGRIAGHDDDATGDMPQLIRIELVTQADVENSGYNRIDAIFRVAVWHQLHAVWNPDSILYGPGFEG